MNKTGLKFHIEQKDYFGTLATILDLLRQEIERKGYARQHGALLQKLRGDLMYLQKNYQITKQRKKTKIASVGANHSSLYVP